MKKILFVHNHPTRFVRLDLAELQKRYQVTECYLRSRWVNPAAIWRQVKSHDLVFGWFASWHTLLPIFLARLLRKPSLLIIGGYDLANMPEIGFGHQRGGLRKWISRWTMDLASCLVTNSYYSRNEAERCAGVDRKRVHVVHHGFIDPSVLPSGGRTRTVLSVGYINRENTRRKGHEPFVRAARLLPDVDFVLIGAWRDNAIEHLRAIATPNVTFTGWLDDETLLDYYRRASVYVQASAHEGFGMSLAEAMLVGCIPIVTRVGAIPEVVGDCGVYVAAQDEPIAHAVRGALDAPLALRQEVRQRILNNFPMEKRRKLFEMLIDRLVPNVN